MGFPKNIKIDTLTASARHCCVCHRYKGLKIEVHHIIQEAFGGENTAENAIALCFDCHADAGHYNKDHPKGTRFSVPELIKAKEEWYKIVSTHEILAPANTSDHLHFRHMILRDYEAGKEILGGDLKEFPFPNTILYPNKVSSFINSFITQNEYLDLSIDYKIFDSEEVLFKTYPDLQLVDKSETINPYFYATRIPGKTELNSLAAKLNPIVLNFLTSGIDPVEYCQSAIVEVNGEGCGDEGSNVHYFQEFIIFKSVWFSFLAITNISSTPAELVELSYMCQNDPTTLTNIRDNSREIPGSFSFPKVAILPNQTILVPTALVLVPFEEEKFSEIIISDSLMANDLRTQTLSHFTRNVKDTEYLLSGPFIKPYSISYNISDRINHSEIHELDLNNFFVLDRQWGMGSCPHLFYRQNGSLLYIRELFIKNPGIEASEEFIIPTNVTEITIVELEQETTYIAEISINNQIVDKNIVLKTGESLTLQVNSSDLIALNGYYVALLENVRNNEKVILRNKIIGRYLRHNKSIN